MRISDGSSDVFSSDLLGAIIDMARAAEVEHHIIADVDERRDRPLAHRFQPAAHPLGRGGVGDAADRAAEEGGAGFGVVGPDFGRGGPFAGDRRDVERLQRAEPGGRSEEHTSELQSLMRISYAVFCLKKKKKQKHKSTMQEKR